MAKDVTTYSGLTAQERLYVESVVEGNTFSKAYADAGYSQGVAYWRTNAATLARKPHIALAIHKGIAARLVGDAAAARRVALELMNDESVAPKVRADLAVKILRLGGHVEPKQQEADRTGDKSLTELTMSELRDRAAALERELAERARPVISANVEPLDAQAIDIVDTH